MLLSSLGQTQLETSGQDAGAWAWVYMGQLQRTRSQAQKDGWDGCQGDKWRLTSTQLLLFTNKILREPFLQTSFWGPIPTGSKHLTGIINLSIHIFKNYLSEPFGWKFPTSTHERFPGVYAGFASQYLGEFENTPYWLPLGISRFLIFVWFPVSGLALLCLVSHLLTIFKEVSQASAKHDYLITNQPHSNRKSY